MRPSSLTWDLSHSLRFSEEVRYRVVFVTGLPLLKIVETSRKRNLERELKHAHAAQIGLRSISRGRQEAKFAHAM
jgi:hypothetical protein